MREHWNLPLEFRFRQTGEDWLLILLGCCSGKQRAHVLLLLWRAWHLRCDVIHEKGKESIMKSVSFLLNYEAMLTDCSPAARNNKGKKAIGLSELTNQFGSCSSIPNKVEDTLPSPWSMPMGRYCSDQCRRGIQVADWRIGHRGCGS
jgi:hypothetical protein